MVGSPAGVAGLVVAELAGEIVRPRRDPASVGCRAKRASQAWRRWMLMKNSTYSLVNVTVP
ncbi:hypothetical protein I6A84_09565 [Frankia sp. CNm7]|uniref:Uncharacterized protein n=1 Tax=Frankia nepalensis TaxID=1836974 RepID=A0A937UV39_9ACTN|nr:hypothetical protein [Frankia nepalensis]MBL7494885.1 hypothetical protein [Frankia nepalensis]MBL7514409.1 hypothetical protein [Frankia nepalensis]MBL7518353.1 hypothetical protein [Frankia nepalensis]MBL7632880.1 hypothetical protein [Frankia nepalensis]